MLMDTAFYFAFKLIFNSLFTDWVCEYDILVSNILCSFDLSFIMNFRIMRSDVMDLSVG